LIGSLAFFSALAGCKTEEAPAPAPDYTRQLGPGESALRKLDPSEWPDVGAPWRVRDPNLTQALDRSITWFGLPPSKTKFPFMQVCTWDQAAASAVAFKQVLQDSKDEASFVAALKQNFDVWQTVGWNGKGVVLFTGYYSPEFKGSLKQTSEFKYPQLQTAPTDIRLLPLDIDASREIGFMLGAGIIVYGATADILDQAIACSRFYQRESCGKCVPCRLGSRKMVDMAEMLATTPNTDPIVGNVVEHANLLSRIMKTTSICGLGQVASEPLRTYLRYFYSSKR
jgi:hypothetical protein